MAKMNLPTAFVYSNGRYQEEVKLTENCGQFCSLCQVELKNVQTYKAHLAGKNHTKKSIAARMESEADNQARAG